MGTIEADYVVVGAGAMGMAFTDALISHADVRVALLDRRHAPGGHWLDAYPFVRLHQASAFYGVASTLLGDGRAQQHGPERGLHERATAAQICAYYDSVLTERLVASGRVSFMPGYVWTDDGLCVSTISGEQHEVRGPARVVNAHYLSPRIPATTMPPFAVDKGAKVIPVNELVRVADAPSEYVVVGSGKTATDACIWLLDHGVDPDRICWVCSREPWMLNRAMIQPDPRIFLGAAADVMEFVATTTTVDRLARDAGDRRSRRCRLRQRPRPQGVGGHGVAQPSPHAAGAGRVRSHAAGAGQAARQCRSGADPHGRARRHPLTCASST